MSQELFFTSIRRGLDLGSRGFCTAAATRGMAPRLRERLQALSAYKHLFDPLDPRNPVIFQHLKLLVGGKEFHNLARIADAPTDYAGRSNFFAHQFALEPAELPQGGPAWLLAQAGVFATGWRGEPRWLRPTRIPQGNLTPARCVQWERWAGDAGWAGVLVEAYQKDPTRPVFVIVHPETDVLTLFAEALALMPIEWRWEVTFSTCFQGLPPGVACAWRGIVRMSGLEEPRGGTVIDLTQPLGMARSGPFVEMARTGKPLRRSPSSQPQPTQPGGRVRLPFLRCLCQALVQKGFAPLRQQLALTDHLHDIAQQTLHTWHALRPDVEQRRAEEEAIAALTPALMREFAENLTEQMAPPTIRADVTRYLECLPGLLRRHCTPFRSHFGIVPALSLDDLRLFLPVRPPRFRPGDSPPGARPLRLRELLGIGGFGEVWKASTRDEAAAPVALKFCLDAGSGRRLFEHETTLNRLVGTAWHPGLVRLKRDSLDTDPAWLEYEYVEGGDLARAIRALANHPPEERREASLAVMHELASILAVPHRMRERVVHRDLKPSNILLEPMGTGTRVRVTDFGIGGVASQSTLSQATRAGLAMTCLRGQHSGFYAPPEQLQGADADPRDDVYALGVIWYQMLTGNVTREPGGAPDETLDDLGTPLELKELVLLCLRRRDRRLADAGLLATVAQALMNTSREE